MNIPSTRDKIERALRGPLSEAEWVDLNKRRYVSEMEDEEMPPGQVAAEIKRQRRVNRMTAHELSTSASRNRSGARDLDERTQALSEFNAGRAAREPGVEDFRDEVLGGVLLSPEEVKPWKRRHGPPEPGDVTRARRTPAVKRIWKRYLAISNDLADLYNWLQPQAKAFLLTGQTPLLHPIFINSAGTPRLGAFDRLTLTVDPEVSPRRLVEFYERARRIFVSRQLRCQSPKHVRLGIFVATRPLEESWRESMSRWNRESPKWKYEHLSNFIRDGKAAVTRLLRPKGEPFRREAGHRWGRPPLRDE